MTEQDGQVNLNNVILQHTKLKQCDVKRIKQRAFKKRDKPDVVLSELIQSKLEQKHKQIKMEIFDQDDLLKKRREAIKRKQEWNLKSFKYKQRKENKNQTKK